MRQTQTAVLERKAVYTDDFTTEPYEAAWAGEARWFVRTVELTPGTRLLMQTQVSPDGLEWVDHESTVFVAEKAGLATSPVREFGSWLRLRGSLEGHDPRARVMIYLALKA
jgi:hypothetical protein